MTTAPPFSDQISELNAASELISANWGALDLNGWGPEANRAQIALGRQRALLEYLVREGIQEGVVLREVLRRALAKPVSEEA
jgi:hypothetical protein